MAKFIKFNRATDLFKKPIPFNIYLHNHSNITGITEHTHDYMQIWYIFTGSCIHLINGKGHSLSKGDLFILPPFVTHTINLNEFDNLQIIGCEFETSFVNENIFSPESANSLFDFAYLEPFLVSSDSVRPRLHLSGKIQLQVEELFQQMLTEFTKEEKYFEINIKADLLKLLAIIAREYENKELVADHALFERYRDAVTAAISYIDANYTDRIYIKDVCKIAMMSQTYFSYIFKHITGKTFTEYINTLRITKATKLLKTTNSSITDICLKVGFNDATYFNKVFKKEIGLTPSQYRNLS